MDQCPLTSWTLRSRMISIATTPTDPLLDPVEGLGVDSPLASGAARWRGALSQTRSLWPSPNTTGGHRHQSTNP